MTPTPLERREKYPLGIQNFPKLRERGYTYVDKTAYIHKLLQDDGQYYFLARPRRFGKSLFMSTLEAFFEGRRELFKGLAIDRLVEDWTPRPVLHWQLSGKAYKTAGELPTLLHSLLQDYEEEYEVRADVADVDVRFRRLLREIYKKTGQRVVVLIDEYDKPLVDNLDDEQLCDEFRTILKGFYGNIKNCDEYIHFAMFTGVTRFSKVSIFSDLNTLHDITLNDEFDTICGITEQEMLANFPQSIEILGRENGLSFAQTIKKLRQCYDGYHFSEKSTGVYNPFSLISAFKDKRFGAYWYATGTTTLLARRVRKDEWDLPELEGMKVKAPLLGDIEAYRDPIPLLFQTGYLTIKGYEPEKKRYVLGYPNQEVRDGFEDSLCHVYVNELLDNSFRIDKFSDDVENGDTEAFMRRLTALFASFPYDDLKKKGGEYWFRSIVYIIFIMVGKFVEVERHTAKSRSDMTVKTKHKIYIFEFKYGNSFSPSEAIRQIVEQGYAEPFVMDTRETELIGVVYRTDSRSLVWETRTMKMK